MNLRSRTLGLLLLACAFLPMASASAALNSHWVGTWAAAPVGVKNADGKFGAADTTFRQIVHLSLGGSTARIILTNELGLDPLTIGAATAALSTGGSSIDPATAAAITFSGHPSITLPPGARVISDPISLKLPASADLAVSLFVPAQPMRQVTRHTFAIQTSYQAPGNAVGEKTLANAEAIASWLFLRGVDVLADGKAAAIAAFGDSITDGANSTQNANARWPDELARRLQAGKKTAHLGVINEAIGGNRILRDGFYDDYGANALARFNRDVLAQAGVRYVILLEGINDIGLSKSATDPRDKVTADELIAAITQLAICAHTHGIRIYGATLIPYAGAEYASPSGEQMRQAINQWIRTTSVLDGFIDFDKATRDPARPEALSPANDSGDHLHPSDAGYKAMGDAIDLNLFTR
ncbi:MAG: SGNH/GDSL hydrolase family protein [Acidobacteriaceae bacterium]|nr:SGNH/GDSL hydrolase family protein [Acidobacteriaceae bacterium]